MTRGARTACRPGRPSADAGGGAAREAGRVVAWAGLLVALTAMALSLLWTEAASAAPASVIYRGPSGSKQIALTFDDNNSTTRAVATLRALQKDRVPATLFLTGSAVAGTSAINGEVIRGMGQGLFEVGDHSWSHPVLTALSTSAMAAQIGGGTEAFRAATGARTVPLFRPPYGSTNSRVAEVAGSEGFDYLILWDVDPRDWEGGSASSIAKHVISHAHSGAIVVMHLSGAHTAAAVPLIVSALRAKGYDFVTISTMLKGDRLFLDVDAGTESGQAIARMAQEGFMNGYDGNYFGPLDTITRAQVAKVATLLGGLHTPEVEKAGLPSFADVPVRRDPGGNPLAYPFDYVEEAAAAGLVVGTAGPDGSMVFRPTEVITRVQLAQILARMVRELKGYGAAEPAGPSEPASPDESPSPPTTFVDVPYYAAADVTLVTGLGLMSGYSDQEFGSWAGAQRAHVALAMSRYLGLPEAPPAD